MGLIDTQMRVVVMKEAVCTHRAMEAGATAAIQGHPGKHQGQPVREQRGKQGREPSLQFFWEGMS